MGRILRSCLQSVLKMVNSVGGLVGVGLILYSLWMIRVWYREMRYDATPPWFIYTFFGLGVSFCLIACSGHISAETANGHCLSCYMVIVFLLVMLEAAITADVFLNRNWEEDFPEDKTGRFNEFKHFIRSNFELCKWIGLIIASAQASSILLAMILKALGPRGSCYYDSDDDSIPGRLPLLQNQVEPATYITNPHVPYKSDSWNGYTQDEIL